MHISTSLVGLVTFFAICYYVGITSSSAIQRSRDLHKFRKANLNNTVSRTTIIQRRYVKTETAVNITATTPNINVNNLSSASNVDSITGEKSTIDANDVKKSPTKNKTMTPSSFWNFIRFVAETYLTEISSAKIIDDYPIGSNTTTSTNTTRTFSKPQGTLLSLTTSSSTDALIATTTNVIPSLASIKKLSAPSRIGCRATCGSCTEITPGSGVIMSPNYPDHYYSATDIGYIYCQYIINVPVGRKIHLEFQKLNLAFTDQGDFIEVVDKSPENYGKVLASFNAGDEALNTTTRGESMSVFFEANPGGYTKNGKAPVWRATYYAVEK